jgi:Na+-transporting NADH:ubiquinone oxidoreductase subunit C
VSDAQTESGGRSRDSIANTLIVAISLSLVCSLLIASTAILLKPQQLRNKNIYRQTIILDVAGQLVPGADIDALFDEIDTRVVDLASGDYVDLGDPGTFDAQAAASDPAQSVAIPAELDLAGIRRRANYAPVYIVMDGSAIDQIILPVYGKGLWSTMYGYLSVAADGTTIRGLRFYEHAETPGLGDQIDKEGWREQWPGKQLYDAGGEPRIEVVRGKALGGANAPYQIDGLSGATLTGRGVSDLVRYWIGPHGFGPYLENFRESSNGNK